MAEEMDRENFRSYKQQLMSEDSGLIPEENDTPDVQELEYSHEYFEKFNKMLEELDKEDQDEQNYWYRAFVEDVNKKASNLDTNEYFSVLGLCSTIAQCNKSIVPTAIENLARFLATPEYNLGLWVQTDTTTPEGSAKEILRDIHDNLEQTVEERIIQFATQKEWEEFLTKELGEQEVVFLKSRPAFTELLRWDWNNQELLRVLFGNRFAFVEMDEESGAVRNVDPWLLNARGLVVVFFIRERNKEIEAIEQLGGG